MSDGDRKGKGEQEIIFEQLIAEEEDAFQQARIAATERWQDRRLNTELGRKWWRASAAVLQEYAALRGRGKEPALPGHAIWRASKVAESLAEGNAPDPVRDALARRAQDVARRTASGRSCHFLYRSR